MPLSQPRLSLPWQLTEWIAGATVSTGTSPTLAVTWEDCWCHSLYWYYPDLDSRVEYWRHCLHWDYPYLDSWLSGLLVPLSSLGLALPWQLPERIAGATLFTGTILILTVEWNTGVTVSTGTSLTLTVDWVDCWCHCLHWDYPYLDSWLSGLPMPQSPLGLPLPWQLTEWIAGATVSTGTTLTLAVDWVDCWCHCLHWDYPYLGSWLSGLLVPLSPLGLPLPWQLTEWIAGATVSTGTTPTLAVDWVDCWCHCLHWDYPYLDSWLSGLPVPLSPLGLPLPWQLSGLLLPLSPPGLPWHKPESPEPGIQKGQLSWSWVSLGLNTRARLFESGLNLTLG